MPENGPYPGRNYQKRSILCPSELNGRSVSAVDQSQNPLDTT